MTHWLADKAFLDALKKGVKRAGDLIALVTDYHGGPITTEYLLTSDIAREFINRHFETQVEFLNRTVVNSHTASDPGRKRKELGSKRTDIALIYTRLIPLALIEVKIGVSTLRKVKVDLEKITGLIACLKPKLAARVVGAVVFQVHVKGTPKRRSKKDLREAVNSIEQKLERDLIAYAKKKPPFSLRMKPLQPAHEGLVEADAENELDGHATRYHAIIIRHNKSDNRY